MKNTVKEQAKSIFYYAAVSLKWIVLAAFMGAIGGGFGVLFRKALDFSAKAQNDFPYIIFLLPIGGILIVLTYRIFKVKKDSGSEMVVDFVREHKKAPAKFMPIVFITTTITHLLYGSSGKEAAALQLGGVLGATVGRIIRLSEEDVNVLVMCGMSSLFSVILGTPFTAAILAIEMISVGTVYYMLFPCIISSVMAYLLAMWLNIPPLSFSVVGIPEMSLLTIIQILGLSLILVIATAIFVNAIRGATKLFQKYMPNEYLRIIVGGLWIIGLTLASGLIHYNSQNSVADIILGHDHNSGGLLAIIGDIIDYGESHWYDFIFTVLFAALTIGSGYKGARIIPGFLVGASFGALVAPLFDISPSFAAAVGMVAVFCGITNCPLAALVLSAEVFGSSGFLYFGIVIAINYLFCSSFALFSKREAQYSKIGAQYILSDDKLEKIARIKTNENKEKGE